MANVYFPNSSAQSLGATAFPRLWLDKLTAGWYRLLTDVSDPYRPERHYMRGPSRNGARSAKAVSEARASLGQHDDIAAELTMAEPGRGS